MPDSLPNILYVHGGGDTIGGIETFLARCLPAHKSVRPYLAIVREGKFSDYLDGNRSVVHLGGGRIRQVMQTLHAVRCGARFVRNEKIKLLIAKGTHSWFFGGLIAKLARIPSFFYLAGDVKPEHFRQAVDGIALRLVPSMYIANSEFTAGSARRYLKGRVEVVRPFPDFSEFDQIDQSYARKTIRNEFGIAEDTFLFVMPARIQKWKGQDTAIQAFKAMKNKSGSALLIVGECTFAFDEPYYLQLKQLSAGDPSIVFAGFRNDIPALLKASDAVIHASRSPEPFGIVVAEGMMAGKPVFATAHGGPTEIISDGVNGFLYAPDDYAQLSLLMDSVQENPTLRQQISNAALQTSREKNNLLQSIDSIESLIHETIARRDQT